MELKKKKVTKMNKELKTHAKKSLKKPPPPKKKPENAFKKNEIE